MTAWADRWIRRTTIGCVGILALIAGTVSYLHMHVGTRYSRYERWGRMVKQSGLAGEIGS